jgi:hypothetical protein
MIFARRIQPDEWVHSSPGFTMNGHIHPRCHVVHGAGPVACDAGGELVPEVADAGEVEGDAGLLGGFDYLGVAD